MDDEEAGRAAQSEWENRWPAGQQRAAGDDSDPLDTPSTPGKEEPAHPRRFQKPLSVINPATLATTEVPDREWIIPDWLGVGYVTINYAPGGEGKSNLAQQLMTSTATGHPWCGLAVTRCRSFALFCEDDPDELHRRQARINAASGLRFDDLNDMRWVSGVGQDNALAHFTSDARMSVANRFAEIEAAARNHQAKLIVLDTAADLFAGNENDRHQVRQFFGLLTRLAIEASAAVLLNAHPSRSGMGTGGDMDGGSTAWSNSARSRWSLSRPKEEDGQSDDSVRILTRRKANYATSGDYHPAALAGRRAGARRTARRPVWTPGTPAGGGRVPDPAGPLYGAGFEPFAF